ncbi:MAG: hypothetical protein JWO97_4618 [Acidobacteria bacterium]|nr:hypothetical protein [Acidobacteriota bacterium]
MSEQQPPADNGPEPETPREHRAEVEETPVMPSWVPVTIGLVLVTIAGLAVYTGMRYPNETLVDRIIKPRRNTRTPANPPPGSTLVFPGEGNERTPDAREPVPSRTRAEITGGGANAVTATMRMSARRGMLTRVTPDDTMIFVNDVAIGEAQQFNSQDEVYDFPAPGSYTVRLVAPGYEERQFIITASEDAKSELAVIDAKLAPLIR